MSTKMLRSKVRLNFILLCFLFSMHCIIAMTNVVCERPFIDSSLSVEVKYFIFPLVCIKCLCFYRSKLFIPESMKEN